MRRVWMLSFVFALACGPPQLGSDPIDGDATDEGDSTSEASTDSSTSSETESTDTETETSDPPPLDGSDSSEFIPPPPDMPLVCDMYEQNCPEGEKCVPYWGINGGDYTCVPVLGEQAPGEPCTVIDGWESLDDCDATSWCWNDVCASFCTGTPDSPECPPGSACVIAGDGSLNICVTNCDPIEQDCGAGLACFWANGNFNCIFTMRNIPAGEPCGFINDCAAGLGCLIADVVPGCEAEACCSGFCDLNLGDGPCEALLPGTACVPFFEENMAPPGYEHVGVCILPP